MIDFDNFIYDCECIAKNNNFECNGRGCNGCINLNTKYYFKSDTLNNSKCVIKICVFCFHCKLYDNEIIDNTEITFLDKYDFNYCIKPSNKCNFNFYIPNFLVRYNDE